MAILGLACLPAAAAGTATTTTLTVTSGGNTIASGGSVVSPAQVTLVATVTAGATPVTKGTVYFCVTTGASCSDINLLGTAQLTSAGTASLTFVPPITAPNSANPPVVTPHSYAAVFLPTATYASSISATFKLSVSGTFATTSVLTSTQTATNPPPYVYSLTDTVTGSTQSYPTGTVSFYDTSNVVTPASVGPPAVPAVYSLLGTAPIVAGTSSFVLKAQATVTSASLPRYINVGDLNGDGIPDLVVSNFGTDKNGYSTVNIFFGKGDGTFTVGPVFEIYQGNGPQFSALGDFENNGCLDIVTEAYVGNGLYYFHNVKTNGVCTGTFSAATQVYNSGTNAPGIYGPGAFGVADFNGDGNLDFIVANNSNAGNGTSSGAYSTIFFGNGNGTFSTTTTRLSPTGGVVNPDFFAVGDYNGDGFPDIAIANNATDTINIYLNNGTGGFTLHTTLATVGGNNTIQAGDVNKDGKLDLVVSSSDTADALNVWLGDGTGGFAKAAADPPVPNPSALQGFALADTNGDGNLDIVANTNPNNGTAGNVFVLLGNGDSSFQAPTATQPDGGLDTLSLAVGDFNADGYTDVALGNFSSNNVAIYTAGYLTTGTATANLPGVTLYGASVNPHLADAVYPTGSVYTTSTSNTVPLQANILPGTSPYESLSVTANPMATNYGQQVALQATFTYTILGSSYQPNGETVTFYQVATNGNLTSIGTATFGTTGNPGCSTATANGTTTTTCTSTILNTTALPLGTDKVEASFNLVAPPALPSVPGTNGADANFTGLISPSVNVTVTQVPGTGQTVSAASSTIIYGTSDQLTYAIPVVVGAAPPTGGVTFASGTTTIATATWPTTPVQGACPGNATATCYLLSPTTAPTNIPEGQPTTITGTFAPGATSGYAALTPAPTTTVTVNQVPSTNDAVSAASPTVTVGSGDALTFSIPVVTGAPVPAGMVTFASGTTALGSATWPASPATGPCPTNAASTCYLLLDTPTPTNFPLAIAPATTTPVTATFTAVPTSGYASGTTSTAVTVSQVPGTGDTLTVLNNPTTYGTSDTLTFKIPVVAGVPAPAGTVTFTASNGTVSLGTATWNAPVAAGGFYTISTTTPNLPIGSPTVATATFAATPTSGYGSSSPVTNVTVGKVPTTGDVLTTSPNPSSFGQSVTLQLTVNSVNGVNPTGTVTFSSNGTTLGTANVTGVLANGVTTYTTSTTILPVGMDPVTATYGGDTTFAGGIVGPVTQTVNPAMSTGTLAVGPNPSTYGSPVTIVETVAPINGVCPAGPVTFLNNGATINTAPMTLTNGSCVATLTTSTLPVGSDAITATIPASGSFGAITSGPVGLVVNKSSAPDVLTSLPNPSNFGTTVVLTDTIPTALPGFPPTGTVLFYSYGTLLGSGTVNAQGVATLSTSTLPVGTDSLTAVYQGDANYAQVTSNAVNQVVSATPTIPTLAAGPNPTTFGTPVTITETIPAVNNTPATGTVTFFQNGVQIGTGTLSNGVASLTLSTLPVGTDPITSTYPGDKNYAAVASGPVPEVINKANGPDALAANPNPAPFGTTVTVTDTVPTVGGVAPTGTVTFYNNGTSIGTAPIVNGVATLTTTTLPVGSNPLTATYGGDANYAPITTQPAVNEVITVGNTTPVLSASPSTTTFGTLVTLTESIPGINGVAPTGTVQFFYNGTLIGTGTVANGTASTTTTTLPIGTDPITAIYSGDTQYAKANSGPVNVTINKANPTDTVTALSSPTPYGTTVTLTFTVPTVNSVVPSGVVTFVNGTTVLGTGNVNAQGVATLTTTTLPEGTDTVIAQYPGDNTYAASNPTAQVTITAATGGDSVTVAPAPATFGSPATISFCIAPVNGAPAPVGTVQFSTGGTLINAPVTIATTATNGCYLATTTTSGLPEGTATPVTGTFTAGTGSGYASGTATTTVNVQPVIPNQVVTYGPQSPTCASTQVTLTDTITPVNGVVPTGTVQFYTDLGPIGAPVTPVNGVATLVTTLPCGISNVYAVFTGTGSYGGPATSPKVPLALADFTIAATPPTQTINPGDTTVYKVTLTGAGGAAFNSPVTLTATGLPPGATVKFGTVTATPGSAGVSTTMTIVTSPTQALLHQTQGTNGIYYGLLLLPLLGLGKVRRKLRALPRGVTYCLAGLLLLGGLGAMTGCSGGYFGPAPKTFTITVTGTSGTLSHSTSVTLTVE